jgi:two-component system sensor histidine kinase QseC
MGMRSIRRHLFVFLLPGFILLWVGAGSAIYHSVTQRYEAQLDAQLRELWAALPFGSRPGHASLLTIEDFTRDDFGIYFQIWDEAGNRILKSENLGRLDLPKAELFEEQPSYRNTSIENGDTVRTLSVSSQDGNLGALKVVVATSREEADAALQKVLLMIVSIGLLTGGIFIVLVSFALRSGLRPLDAVGTQAARIDVDSLSARFPSENLPKELHPIALRLNDLMSRIEQSFTREKRFSADLAHELRTPVAALKSIAEVAIKWPAEATDDNYDDILKISSELQTTIENLLTLARLEKAEEELLSEEVRIRAAVEDCWPPFKPIAVERKLVFRNSLGENLIFKTDPKLIRVILSNLLSNAAEYAPEGSEVEISADDATLIVANPAPHLTETDLPRMFDRLWRHDDARTASNHSGLGLALAKACAEALSLDLEPRLEGDSLQFRLHFPAKKG